MNILPMPDYLIIRFNSSASNAKSRYIMDSVNIAEIMYAYPGTRYYPDGSMTSASSGVPLEPGQQVVISGGAWKFPGTNLQIIKVSQVRAILEK